MGKANNCSCNSCAADVKNQVTANPDQWLTEVDAMAAKRAASTTKPPPDKIIPPAKKA